MLWDSWYCFIYFQAFSDEEFKSALRKEVVQYKFETSVFDIVVSMYLRATEIYAVQNNVVIQGQMTKPCDN